MRKFIRKHSIVLGIGSFLLVWRIFLFIIEQSRYMIPTNLTYFGIIPQANFDGVYYLSISQFWYRGLDQAFFPMYPLAIRFIFTFLSIQPFAAGIILSILCLFLFLRILYSLIILDGFRISPMWAILFYLCFPSSFFLASIYTEGFFIFLVILSFYFIRKKMTFLACITAMFSAVTRVVGIFLLPALFMEIYFEYRKNKKKLSSVPLFFHFLPLVIIPAGLLTYMGFLWYKYGDPLLFVHLQPAFGAGRSGGTIILLPQVMYRYVKIFTTVSSANLTFWISFLEFSTLVLGILILYLAWKRGIRKSYIIFSLCVLFFPTLSGTLSSLPRYALAAFAMFIFLGMLKNKILKIVLIISGLVLQGILAMLFLQGYFVS